MKAKLQKTKPTFQLACAVTLNNLLRELDPREHSVSAHSGFENGPHVFVSSANDFVSRTLIRRKWRFDGHGYPFQCFTCNDAQTVEDTIADIAKAIAAIR